MVTISLLNSKLNIWRFQTECVFMLIQTSQQICSSVCVTLTQVCVLPFTELTCIVNILKSVPD